MESEFQKIFSNEHLKKNPEERLDKLSYNLLEKQSKKHLEHFPKDMIEKFVKKTAHYQLINELTTKINSFKNSRRNSQRNPKKRRWKIRINSWKNPRRKSKRNLQMYFFKTTENMFEGFSERPTFLSFSKKPLKKSLVKLFEKLTNKPRNFQMGMKNS